MVEEVKMLLIFVILLIETVAQPGLQAMLLKSLTNPVRLFMFSSTLQFNEFRNSYNLNSETD